MKFGSFAAILGVVVVTGGAFLLGSVYGPGLVGIGEPGLLSLLSLAPASARTEIQDVEDSSSVADGHSGSRKILYYRNPMGLPDISSEPKKDSMGMEYIPVYEGEESEGSTVKVGLEKVQRLGVVTEPAQLRDGLVRTVRAVGTIALDERSMAAVTTKIEGWVERLYVNTTGQQVAKGAPMLEIYSPDLVLAQQDYLIALGSLDSARAAGAVEETANAERLVEGAIQRLRYFDISAQEVEQLRKSRAVRRGLMLRAPLSGQVMEKMVVEGMRVMPGEPLFELADLSRVWVIAEVFEQDMAMVQLGQAVAVAVTTYPGESFAGKVDFIYPAVDPTTRTGRIRVEIDNPDGRLKEHMYASISLQTAATGERVVVVPESALLDSGQRQVVLVDKGAGRFEPREVRTGTRADGFIEIVEGLGAGEQVVVRANFLIDAESNLQAALRAFVAPPGAEGPPAVGGDALPPPAAAPVDNTTN
ncbi:MAG TPA: efflux RND transporter periplasmic adaptor subunit [Alphaproteobacteria bacterium]|nr:efflux RND transporter periplasmic adaptor subunit [Alphaproteobacteria bacterium]